MPSANPNLDVVGLAKTAGVDPTAAQAEVNKYNTGAEPTVLNPDVAVGNVLMNQNKTVPETTVKNSDYVQSSDAATNDVSSAQTSLSDNDSAYKTDDDTYKKSVDLLTQRSADLEDMRKSAVQDIEKQSQIDIADTNTKNRLMTGASAMNLARMGGVLGGTGSGQAYLNSLQVTQTAEINKLELARTTAINSAKLAYSDKQFETAKELVNQAKDYEQQIYNRKSNALKLMTEAIDLNNKKLSEIAESGVMPSDQYLAAMDKNLGYETGVSKALLKVAAEEKQMKLATNAEDLKIKQNEAAKKLADTLNSIPAGTPIEIGKYTYYGTMGTGKLEIDSNGYGRMATVSQIDGTVSTINVGFLGKPQDGWQIQFDGNGNPWSFNTKSGQLIFAGDPSKSSNATGTDWSKIIPDGSKGGQCGAFVNNLTGIGVGDTLESKASKIDKTIGTTANPIQIGDVVVTSEGGWTGHVAIVNAIIEGKDGKQVLRLTESNFNHDEKVTNTRQLTADASVVKGFARGSLDSRLQTGTDKFVPKSTEVTIGGDRYRKNPDGTYAKVVESIDEITVAGDRYRRDPLTGEYTKVITGKITGVAKVATTTDMTAYSDIKNKPIKQATEKLIGGLQVGTQKEALRNDVAVALGEGDIPMVVEKVKTAAKDQLGIEAKTRVEAAEKAQYIVPSIKSLLTDYIKSGGQLDIFTGTASNIASKLGASTDPKLTALRSLLDSYTQTYRRSMTGAAFSENETEEYQKILPHITDTLETSMARIDGFLEAQNLDMDATYRVIIGDEAWKGIKELGKSLSDQVRAKGYDYAAMQKDGMTDEQIKSAIGI